MKPDVSCKALADCILSGHLHCPTTEITRLLSEPASLAGSLPDGGRQVNTWTINRLYSPNAPVVSSSG